MIPCRACDSCPAAAELLAAHQWPRLYDAERLAANDVPVAATIYVNDLYENDRSSRNDLDASSR